jgi:hypothetical protein
MGPRAAPSAVLLWLLALSLLQSRSVITSRETLDAWGQTVLRRAVGVTWAFFALHLCFHLRFWAEQGLSLALLVPLAMLLTTRWADTEGQTWALLTITLLVTGIALPSLLSATALAAAALLALRGLASWRARTSPSAEDPSTGPYRSEHAHAEPAHLDTAAIARRAFLGATLSLYLSLWTLGWSGGPFPAHLLPLDLLLTAALAAALYRHRHWPALAPVTGLWVHFVWQARLIPAPRTLQQWGGASIGLGFALLGGSLAVSYWLRPTTD